MADIEVMPEGVRQLRADWQRFHDEIDRLRKIEEHAGLMRDTIESLSVGHAANAETVRASLRLLVKAYDEGAL